MGSVRAHLLWVGNEISCNGCGHVEYFSLGVLVGERDILTSIQEHVRHSSEQSYCAYFFTVRHGTAPHVPTLKASFPLSISCSVECTLFERCTQHIEHRVELKKEPSAVVR